MELSEFLHKNKWCLEKSILALFVHDASKQGNANRAGYSRPILDDLGNKVDEDIITIFSLPLRSSMSDIIFYEIVVVEEYNRTDVFINMWIDGKDSKYVVVYHNNRIIRWGAWAVELMDTLPGLIARLASISADAKIKNATAAIHGAGTLTGEFSRMEMELALNWEHEPIDTDAIYAQDKSGSTLDFL